MQLDFVPESAMELAGKIRQIEQLVQNSLRRADSCLLDASFSNVPGLNQLGQSHGQVLHGATGSASEVLQSYAQHMGWMAEALAASIGVVTEQEAYNAHGIYHAGEGQGAIQQATLDTPVRPLVQYGVFTFAPPVTGGSSSIQQLASDFAGTDTEVLREASHVWTVMSGEIADVARQLLGVAEELRTLNKGDIFEVAAKVLHAASDIGLNFSENAATMADTLQQIDSVHSWGSGEVAVAQAKINAIEDPALRKLAEQEFLGSFMGGEFPAALQAGVPSISGLMDSTEAQTIQHAEPDYDSKSSSGNNFNNFGVPESGDQGLGTSPSISKVMADTVIHSAEQLLTDGNQPLSIGSTGSHPLGQVLDGIQRIFGNIGTHQAAVPGPITTPHAPSFGMSSPSMHAFHPGNYAATPFESSLIAAPQPQNFVKSGMNGVEPITTQIKHTSNTAPITGATTPSGIQSNATAVPGTVGGAPMHSVFGKRPQTAPITSGPFHPTPGTQTPLGSGGGVAGSGGFMGGQHGVRGHTTSGVPMGAVGAPGAGSQMHQSQGKGKVLTNKLERNKNVHDLIGDLPPVLDGPIGAWVRE